MRAIRTQHLLTLATLVLGAGLYPLAVLAIGQTFFRDSTNGSLIVDSDGTVRGSRLVFASDEWFQPRPSAVNYNAGGLGGSNLGASNPKPRDRVIEQLKTLSIRQPVPADAVTTSGSDLDPYSLRASNSPGGDWQIIGMPANLSYFCIVVHSYVHMFCHTIFASAEAHARDLFPSGSTLDRSPFRPASGPRSPRSPAGGQAAPPIGLLVANCGCR